MLTADDIPVIDAPTGTEHCDVTVQARRTVGSQVYSAWQARSIRLFIPDGIKLAEAEFWIGYGADARLSALRADLFVELGGSAGLSVPQAELHIEHGPDARLGLIRVDLYIEVIP